MKNITTISINDIQIGDRHRKDLGDIDGLAKSISEDGMLQPIGITPDNRLVFGYRRLVACRDKLGMTEIPAVIIDIENLTHAEWIENTIRKDLTMSEMVAITDALRSYSRGGDRRSDQYRENGTGVTKKEACEIAGWKLDRYDDAKKVVENAIDDLVQAMDKEEVSPHAAAQLAKEPEDIQREAVKRIAAATTAAEKRGIIKTVNRIKSNNALKQRRLTTPTQPPARVGDVEIWCGDSLSLMRERIAPQSVDVAVTSVPYNIGVKYDGYDDNKSEAEYFDWLADCFEAIKSSLKVDGSFFLNIDSPSTSPWTAMRVAEVAGRFFKLQNRIIWAKSKTVDGRSQGQFRPLPGERFLNHVWESVFHFTKEGKTPLDRLGIGVPYVDKRNLMRNQAEGDLRCGGDVWFVPYETTTDRSDKGFHPCPFPVELAERCIKLHGVTENMTVLDPFNGSGSSTAAMARLGVGGVGIDLSAKYCGYAVERLAKVEQERIDAEACQATSGDADVLNVEMVA